MEFVVTSSFLDLFAGGGLSSPLRLRIGVLEDGRGMLLSGILFVWVVCGGADWGGTAVRGVVGSPSMSERVLFNCCDDVDGAGDKTVGTYGPGLVAFGTVVELYAGVVDVYVFCREGAADVDGVNKPCARP